MFELKDPAVKGASKTADLTATVATHKDVAYFNARCRGFVPGWGSGAQASFAVADLRALADAAEAAKFDVLRLTISVAERAAPAAAAAKVDPAALLAALGKLTNGADSPPF